MADTNTVTDNVTELRPPSSPKASRRSSRKAANERQRRYRRRKAEVASNDALAGIMPPPPATVTAIRNAARDAAAVTAPESNHVARLMVPATVPEVATLATSRREYRAASTRTIDALAYTAAVTLAGAAAWFSIRGMVVLFPGSPVSVIGLAVAMESAKLITAAWLASRWRATAWIWRFVLMVLVAGLATINATGVYAQLVAAHVGMRAALTSTVETQGTTIAAEIEQVAGNVRDLDRRLGQIDTAIEEATRRGRTKTAMATMETQQRARSSLVDERKREAATLVSLQTERAQVAAKGRQAETEAAPIRYVAELLGVDSDSERAIRWLIALMVLCADPLAIAITAATSARRMR